MANALSYSSPHNSKSSDTIRNLGSTSHGEPFASESMNNMTTTGGRISLHFLHQVTQTLPNERAEYRQRLASAIKDSKEQYVPDFLR